MVNNIVFHYISGSIKKLSYKGQALTLEFATKMITHLQEAKQQQVELVTIAIDTDLVLQGSASNSQIGRKAVRYLFKTFWTKKLFLLESIYGRQNLYDSFNGNAGKAASLATFSDMLTLSQEGGGQIMPNHCLCLT